MDSNAHGLPNGKPAEFYEALDKGELSDYRTRGRESRDTIYLAGMFLRVLRGLDVLTAQPEWDGRILIVHGNSQGGYLSLVAAGLDPRVTFFAASIPAGCDLTGVVANRTTGAPNFFHGDRTPPPNVVDAVRYVDTMNFATRTKAAGIITVGFIDALCTPTSVYATYNGLPGSKQIHNDVSSGHALSNESMAAMQKAILDHVRNR